MHASPQPKSPPVPSQERSPSKPPRNRLPGGGQPGAPQRGSPARGGVGSWWRGLSGALLFGAVALASGCAPREYLTPGRLTEITSLDPRLEMVRVYPSKKLIVVYERSLGQGFDIERSQGAIQEQQKARRIEVTIPRKLRGAILEVDRKPDRTLLWVTFDAQCTSRSCAYGFAETDDALYRLYSVPAIEGYTDPSVYRGQVSRRRRMARTKVFSRSRSVPVYFTTRGITASIALDIKRTEDVEVETIKVQGSGVPGQVIVGPQAPPQEESVEP
jgi:hypothetical protein